MKKIAILGSTGSIGTQTLDVIENSSEFKVVSLTAGSNIKLLEEQIRKFSPEVAAVYDEKMAEELKILVSDTNTKVLSGIDGICVAASEYNANIVVTAIVGSIGILPTLKAIESGADIALANKETMVCAGDIINEAADRFNVSIIPVDSEHSAIFQCLHGQDKYLKTIYLTASGGPFFGRTRSELEKVTLEDALKHPNWSMGAKITIDSASLINKGLEVIEAVHLFRVKPSKIKVLVHRQSIIHSMVEFCDNSVLAQLGMPDMRVPINYALHYPKRAENPSKSLDFESVSSLTFEKPDLETFKGLALAYKAIETGGTLPTVYSSANEAATNLFLNRKCSFLDIPFLVEKAMDNHKTVINPDLKSIINSDRWAREFVLKVRG